MTVMTLFITLVLRTMEKLNLMFIVRRVGRKVKDVFARTGRFELTCLNSGNRRSSALTVDRTSVIRTTVALRLVAKL